MATKPALKSVAPADANADAPKKSKKILIFALIGLVVLLAGGGAGAWFFLHKDAPAEAGAKAAAKPKTETGAPPSFVTLEPFTVNLSGGEHFLQIGIVLQTKDEAAGEHIKVHLPQIRNQLLLLLSSKTPADLETLEGKQKLSQEILSETRQAVGEAAAPDVQSVLFGSMVIQ